VPPILVSARTPPLRGHYPVEPDVMAEELGPFDAHFLTPAFFEAGRYTATACLPGGERIPTRFMKPNSRAIPVFGYHTATCPITWKKRPPANQGGE